MMPLKPEAKFVVKSLLANSYPAPCSKEPCNMHGIFLLNLPCSKKFRAEP